MERFQTVNSNNMDENEQLNSPKTADAQFTNECNTMDNAEKEPLQNIEQEQEVPEDGTQNINEAEYEVAINCNHQNHYEQENVEIADDIHFEDIDVDDYVVYFDDPDEGIEVDTEIYADYISMFARYMSPIHLQQWLNTIYWDLSPEE